MSALVNGLSPDARRIAAAKPWRPRNAVWELTLACNLHCMHCGSRAGRPREDELSPAECLDVVSQLADLGGELLTLSGGEPLLRDDWDAIARAAVDRGLAVNMVTNGTLVDERAAGRAVAAGLCNVGVSLDGPEAVHDAIRGRGAFRRTVRGIERLRDAGMSVAVLTTVHRMNLPWLAGLRLLAIDLGVRQWRLQLGKPMGALKDHDDLVLLPRQIPALVDAIVRMKAAGGIAVAVGDSIGYCGPGDRALRGRGWRGRAEAWQGCQAGLQAIGIESDGGIKGCLSLQARDGEYDPFREGGLRDASMAELWFRPGAFAYNRDAGVQDLTGACRSCRHAARCRGGAKCVAAAFTGALTEDPFCDYRIRSLDARPGLREVLARGAAAAAATVMMGLPGCLAADGSDARPDAMAEVASDAVPDGASSDPGPGDVLPVDPGVDAIDCTNVCCMCDYGVIPDEVYQACCVGPTDVPAVDPGLPDLPPADPGRPDVLPIDPAPADMVPIDPGPTDLVPIDPGPADLVPIDPGIDAIDCASVCCACEYGVIPDEVYRACCVGPTDVPAADPGLPDLPPADPGLPDVLPVDPAPADLAPIDPGTDAIDCASVCCMCDYGVIPDEVYKACCELPDVPLTDPGARDLPAVDVPADLPPPDAAPDAVDCAAQPCLSDPESISAADFEACCAGPCTPPPCCECDYGLPPPPQCCR